MLCVILSPTVVLPIFWLLVPFWGVVKKETLFSANSSIVVPHSPETSMVMRQPWGLAPSLARLLCSLLIYLQWSIPARHLWCFSGSAQQRKCNPQPWVEKGSALPEPEGSWLIWAEVPAPSLIGLSLCKYTLQIPTVWSKRHRPEWSEWSYSE